MAEKKELTIGERLLAVQTRLKAPKGQKNTFGNYSYRSCEDILEAVKPLLNEYKLVLRLWDEIELIGDRYYVKSTAHIENAEDNTKFEQAIAYAREAETKKGMDEAQITGSASSYARKYALNGLFDIDDTKDADTNEQREQVKNAPELEKYELSGAKSLKIKSLLSALDVFDDKRNAIIGQVTSDAKADELVKKLEEKLAAKKDLKVEPIE